jgi:hypothetical protein
MNVKTLLSYEMQKKTQKLNKLNVNLVFKLCFNYTSFTEAVFGSVLFSLSNYTVRI